MRRTPPVAGADCWAREDPADTKPAVRDDGCEGLMGGRAAPLARLAVRMLSRPAPAPDAHWRPPFLHIPSSTKVQQNRLFQSDQKRLYKSLERPMVSGTGPAPNQADTVAFWRGLWSEPINHSEGPWTEVVASQCASITPMDPVIITPDDVAEAVRRAPNWKSPGLDGLHHYWLKGFVVCHTVLARQFQEAPNQKSLPSLFTAGITHLVPKTRLPQTRANTAPSRVCRPYTRH
ncbi:unnamed protein product [Parnassius apollo]|uniref:(apollo) hypothetical protein n=1 Tax=Parnassius apollo TaxID=110799 RepID=A0A8S3XQQ4_PARAO|nr:unnamed protein product [Parnassius apollo]